MLTLIRKSIEFSCGRYLEVTKTNIDEEKWNELKEEIILGLKAIQ